MKLLRADSVVWLVGVFLLIVVCGRTVGYAEELFFDDDFGDRSVSNDEPLNRDGMPVRWAQSSFDDIGTLSAATGDLILTDVVVVESFPVFGDTSIRTRVTLPVDSVGDQVFVGVQARRNDTTNDGYSAGLWPAQGTAFIVRETGSVFLDEARITPDVSQEDVILQFDAIGEELKIWVWRPGEPMPATPQVMANDGMHPDGVISLFSVNFLGPDPEAIFRDVQVDTKHIPEPSTILLSGLASLGIILAGRRRLSRV